MSYLLAATGYLEHLRDSAAAASQLEALDQLLASDRWQPSDNDMSRQWYVAEAQKVRAKMSKK
ncbi:hypothetical protein DSM104443_00269 [Usitatibacter rugosus]|uniref:Uncharacterized protein n=2 Tax=Usitatibacter rugosus TaxID=2732067 RepID=A0A6M4GPX8_9PROT|nr:hypothetical protein DSM104443_00269 [Usitatibacter rugosus]